MDNENTAPYVLQIKYARGLVELAKYLEFRTYAPEEMLTCQGTKVKLPSDYNSDRFTQKDFFPNRNLVFISQGILRVFTEFRRSKSSAFELHITDSGEIPKLKAGDYFGEISFLFGCCHTATIKSQRPPRLV